MSITGRYSRQPVPGYDTWVRLGDLTDEMVQDITSAQRREAARWGDLKQFDDEYAARVRRPGREGK
jgi:hypothetical protein